jgi:hypothetical protein
MLIRSLFLLICLGFATLAQAQEELVMIQAVSASYKSFAIRKGATDGVVIGQESLFTNKNVSFAATAKAVNRYFSVWEVVDKRGTIPFDKGDFVSFNSTLEQVFAQIPKLRQDTRDLAFRPFSSWVARGSYTATLSEAVSEASTEQAAGRSGFNAEMLFARRFHRYWEFMVGGRIDRETAQLSEPALDIPTQRTMLAGELLYHFPALKNSDDNVYVGIGMAWGRSQTTIDETVSVGSALVLPAAKIGYQYALSDGKKLLFEGVLEAISSEESFEDTTAQSTSVVNSKFSIGLRF